MRQVGERTGLGGGVSRRELLAGAVLAAGLPVIAFGAGPKVVKKGRIKQAICGGCLRKLRLSMADTVKVLAEMGLSGMDFVKRGDWDLFKKNGLVATMASLRQAVRVCDV